MVRALPNHSLVDRLVRGRAWIPVLGVLLAGIVAMQVEILKLGTSLGRSLEQTTTLQSQNESLQARVAVLADDQRIERIATGMGMVMPTPGLLTFVAAHPEHQLGKAIANVHAPDSATFTAQLAAQIASAALVTPATAAPTGTTTGTTTSTSQTSTAAPAAGTVTTTTSSGGQTAPPTTGATPTVTAPTTPTVSATPTTAQPTTSTNTGAAGLPTVSAAGSSPGG